MDDTLSKHIEAEAGTEQLEDLRNGFGGSLSALIAGHDVDVDRRRLNREFVNSDKGEHREVGHPTIRTLTQALFTNYPTPLTPR